MSADQGRQLLDAVGQAVHAARQLRDQPPERFADVDVDDLERAVRGLERVAADCRQGADVLRRAIAERDQPT